MKFIEKQKQYRSSPKREDYLKGPQAKQKY
jgi:hypothetical protein